MKRKPRLGQNFLVDQTASLRIVEALGDISSSTVVEIGPGHGAITNLLAPRAKRLIAIELDRILGVELRQRFIHQGNVEIIEADVLQVSFVALLNGHTPAKVIGNLPYYITSDILLHLFAAGAQGLVSRAVVMMQREVADRVAASPGSRDYGLLSATAQLHAQVENLFTLPPSAFSPSPEVHSSVLRLDFAPRFDELRVDAAGFDTFLKASFAQKRKTLSNNLRNAGYTASQLQRAWPDNLPSQARAESISPEEMAAIYRALKQHG
jgi:16S rRNA (adenine1518-N6/adenine1519-N6)-dimethyltransferase